MLEDLECLLCQGKKQCAGRNSASTLIKKGLPCMHHLLTQSEVSVIAANALRGVVPNGNRLPVFLAFCRCASSWGLTLPMSRYLLSETCKARSITTGQNRAVTV